MSRPTPQQPSRRRRPSGFTLLEILVVVVLIGILTSLLVIGIKHLTDSSKRQQTRALLTQCQAMYADWQTIARQPFPPSVMPAPQNVTAGDRYGAAVWFTRDVMSHLRSTPANSAALGKMPATSLMNVAAGQVLPFPPPYTTNVKVWDGTLAYTPFDSTQFGRVYRPDPNNSTTYIYYECIQFVPAAAAASPNPAPELDPTHWFAGYPVLTGSGTTAPSDTNVPVLLDAWGNPIIFVPGGVLGANPDPANVVTGRAKADSGAVVSGSGAAAIPVQAKSPDGRPFFASAGPDGDFSTGDDNLYSYEK